MWEGWRNDCFHPYKGKIKKIKPLSNLCVMIWAERLSWQVRWNAFIFPMHSLLCTLHVWLHPYTILGAHCWKAIISYLCRAPSILLRHVHYKTFLLSDRSAVNPPEPLQPLETLPKPVLNHHYFSWVRDKHYFKPEKNHYNNFLGSDYLQQDKWF